MLSSVPDRVSYHVVYDESILSALEYAHVNGFSGIQIGVESPHLSFERLTDAEVHAIADYAAAHGIRISLHGPDDTASLFASSQHLMQGIFNYFQAMFNFAESAGCKLITLHMGSMATYKSDETPVQVIPQPDLIAYRSMVKSNLDRLVDLAAGRFTLCIENYKLDDMGLGLIQPYLEDGSLFLCWDLAKTFDSDMKVKDQLEDYFWSNLQYIRQVHLHDMSATRRRSHLVIGSADLDFMHFLPRLSEADITDYCIEVRPQQKAKESLDNLKQMIHSA